jgi:hypothetical protein
LVGCGGAQRTTSHNPLSTIHPSTVHRVSRGIGPSINHPESYYNTSKSHTHTQYAPTHTSTTPPPKYNAHTDMHPHTPSCTPRGSSRPSAPDSPHRPTSGSPLPPWSRCRQAKTNPGRPASPSAGTSRPRRSGPPGSVWGGWVGGFCVCRGVGLVMCLWCCDVSWYFTSS